MEKPSHRRPSKASHARSEDPSGNSYYYVAGERVPLHPLHDMLALQVNRKSSSAEFTKALRGGTGLTQGYTLINTSEIDAALVTDALTSGEGQPVFESHGTTIVVLPEVRVEESRGAKKLATIRHWLASRAADVDVAEADGRFEIHLRSNKGVDALILANQISEELAPEMVQPRFVRLLRRSGD